MPHMPTLRVVPLGEIRRHEEVDPFRVARLRARIDEEGTQVNPMVCTETPGGDLVLLDGATRTEALKSLGLEHAVVQMVDRDAVRLETWHHVIRQASPLDVIAAISAQSELMLSEDQGTPRLYVAEQGTRSVLGTGASVTAGQDFRLFSSSDVSGEASSDGHFSSSPRDPSLRSW